MRSALSPRAHHRGTFPNSRAQARVTRKDFTDRLGLPADASNADVFAALDAKLAGPTPTATADDQLYEAMYGAPGPAPATADDELYRKMFG